MITARGFCNEATNSSIFSKPRRGACTFSSLARATVATVFSCERFHTEIPNPLDAMFNAKF
jgi:hypothetical protein